MTIWEIDDADKADAQSATRRIEHWARKVAATGRTGVLGMIGKTDAGYLNRLKRAVEALDEERRQEAQDEHIRRIARQEVYSVQASVASLESCSAAAPGYAPTETVLGRSPRRRNK